MIRTEQTNHNVEGQSERRDDDSSARTSKRVRRISTKLLIDCGEDVDWTPLGQAGVTNSDVLKESEEVG